MNSSTQRQVWQWYYRESFYRFFLRAWKILEPTMQLVDNWHIQYLCNTIQDEVMRVVSKQPRTADLVINVPPATTKSSIVTVAAHPWAWIVEPSLKIITASYADTLAHYHAGKSRDIILSDWYQDLFGDLYALRLDVNKKSEFANDKQGMRYAVGSGGSAIGRHADIQLCDDPINPKKSASQTELETINEWWDVSMSGRLTDVNVSTRILVMQRLATNDLSGHCLAKGYRHICLPAELGDNVQPAALAAHYTDGLLDPVRLGREALDMQRTALGTLGYVGQYLQRPVAAGGNMIKGSWFREFTMTALHADAEEAKTPLVWHFTVDGAYTDKEKNDATALAAWCVWRHNLYIREVSAVRLEMPELLRYLPEFVNRNGYTRHSKVYIEPKANGMSVAQMLRRNTQLNIILDTAPTTDKRARVAGCSPYIEAGRVHLLQGAPYVKPFTDEVCAFPLGDHDDQVDVLTMAVDKAITSTRSAQKWHG
jgi:predicted phage terminase large subunit-like protein